MKNRIALLSAECFHDAGRRAAVFIKSLEIWQKCQTVLLFMSVSNEIDTMPLIEAALEDSKRLFLPVVENKPVKKIWFYRTAALDLENLDFWKSGFFGIKEPDPERSKPLELRDFPGLIITPGLAFDRDGNRLGHGKGFYDRFFEEVKDMEFYSIGLCMDMQIVQSVPVEKNDFKLDNIYAF